MGYYLDRGYDRVSGFVHRATEVGHLTGRAARTARWAWTSTGSPFSVDADEMYLLRWSAHRPICTGSPTAADRGGHAGHAGLGHRAGAVPWQRFRAGRDHDVIAEFKVDSTRLPHGAHLWRLNADGDETLIAIFDADGRGGVRTGGTVDA